MPGPLTMKQSLRSVWRLSIAMSSRMLQPLERSLMQRYGEQGIRKYPPLFIIGAPRCGSTLLYQILTERYKVAFFSNFSAQFYRTPIVGIWIQTKLGLASPTGRYDFRYGRIAGRGAPAECGQFWYRWFPQGPYVYVKPNQTSQRVLHELRGEFGGISTVSGCPMLVKNLYNSLRIAPILEAIPEASFLVCKRNPLDHALSILQARIVNCHRKDQWWSLPPREIDELLNAPYAEQIAGQIYYIYRQIEQDALYFGTDRFLEIHYEELCADVYGTLRTIEQFLAGRDCVLQKRFEVPEKFQVRTVKDISSEDRKLVQDAIARVC